MTRYSRKRSFLIGLIGQDIQGSRTPELHMQEGEAQGFRYLYRLVDLTRLRLGVDALPTLLAAAEKMGFNGLNITHPCKQAVIAHLDELSDDARALEAVNTVVLKDGKRIGQGHGHRQTGLLLAVRVPLRPVPIDGPGSRLAHAVPLP